MENNRLEELLERIANGVERLAEDPVVEIETGPPVCPACGRFNPVISVRENEAQGPISEYLLHCSCNSCGQRFYALPVMWQMFNTRQEIEAALQERREHVNP